MRKIRRRLAYPVILLAFFAQILVSNFLGSSSAKPNFMIVATAFFAIFTDRRFGFEAGLVSGLLLDIFSVRFFGLNAVLFALGGYIIGRYNAKFYRDSVITHSILTFALSLFILSLYFLFVNLYSPSAPQRSGLSAVFSAPLFIPSLLNSFLGIWAYAFLSRVFQLGESAL